MLGTKNKINYINKKKKQYQKKSYITPVTNNGSEVLGFHNVI